LTRSEVFQSISAKGLFKLGDDEIPAAKLGKVENFLRQGEQDTIEQSLM